MTFWELSIFLQIYIAFFSFLFGTVFASGLMCLSWRITHQEKWTSGRSHCDSCGHVLGFKDLIPIVSFLSTKGRCRYCGTSIGKGTLFGELFLGLVTMLLPMRFGVSLDTLKYLIFIYVLFCIALCDLYSFEIPNRFILIGCISFVVFLFGDMNWKHTGIQGLLGGTVIATAVFLISLIMGKLLQKDALGFGDIKLMFMTGLYFGLLGNLLMLILSCFLGLGLHYFLAKHAPEDEEVPEGSFPFGPAIALAAMICVFVGEPLVQLYLRLL